MKKNKILLGLSSASLLLAFSSLSARCMGMNNVSELLNDINKKSKVYLDENVDKTEMYPEQITISQIKTSSPKDFKIKIIKTLSNSENGILTIVYKIISNDEKIISNEFNRNISGFKTRESIRTTLSKITELNYASKEKTYAEDILDSKIETNISLPQDTKLWILKKEINPKDNTKMKITFKLERDNVLSREKTLEITGFRKLVGDKKLNYELDKINSLDYKNKENIIPEFLHGKFHYELNNQYFNTQNEIIFPQLNDVLSINVTNIEADEKIKDSINVSFRIQNQKENTTSDTKTINIKGFLTLDKYLESINIKADVDKNLSFANDVLAEHIISNEPLLFGSNLIIDKINVNQEDSAKLDITYHIEVNGFKSQTKDIQDSGYVNINGILEHFGTVDEFKESFAKNTGKEISSIEAYKVIPSNFSYEYTMIWGTNLHKKIHINVVRTSVNEEDDTKINLTFTVEYNGLKSTEEKTVIVGDFKALPNVKNKNVYIASENGTLFNYDRSKELEIKEFLDKVIDSKRGLSVIDGKILDHTVNKKNMFFEHLSLVPDAYSEFTNDLAKRALSNIASDKKESDTSISVYRNKNVYTLRWKVFDKYDDWSTNPSTQSKIYEYKLTLGTWTEEDELYSLDLKYGNDEQEAKSVYAKDADINKIMLNEYNINKIPQEDGSSLDDNFTLAPGYNLLIKSIEPSLEDSTTLNVTVQLSRNGKLSEERVVQISGFKETIDNIGNKVTLDYENKSTTFAKDATDTSKVKISNATGELSGLTLTNVNIALKDETTITVTYKVKHGDEESDKVFVKDITGFKDVHVSPDQLLDESTIDYSNKSKTTLAKVNKRNIYISNLNEYPGVELVEVTYTKNESTNSITVTYKIEYNGEISTKTKTVEITGFADASVASPAKNPEVQKLSEEGKLFEITQNKKSEIKAFLEQASEKGRFKIDKKGYFETYAKKNSKKKT